MKFETLDRFSLRMSTTFLLSSLLLFREFGRWKVNNLAVERRDFLESQLPLTPEFVRNIRLLGRRPTTQMITDNLIKKYGTHFLLSATLGGKKKKMSLGCC